MTGRGAVRRAGQRGGGKMTNKKALKEKEPVFFKKATEDETDEQLADAICDALLTIVNEERRREGLPPLE